MSQLPSQPPSQAPGAWPLNKPYDGGTHPVLAEHTLAYAAATGDLHPAYEGPEAVAPPMFHVRPMRDLIFGIATDPELGLDMARLVHGEHRATFYRPLRVGEALRCAGRLEEVVQKPSGLTVRSRLEGWVEGELVVDATTVFFIRGPSAGRAAAPAEAPDPPPPDYEAAIPVPERASYAYAEASLDRNPIHLNPDFARAAGLPDVILHGLCTMALTGREAVRCAGGGDPRHLRALGVRFARPVLNGQVLRALGWRQPGGAVALETLGPEGRPVLTQGLARFGPPSPAVPT